MENPKELNPSVVGKVKCPSPQERLELILLGLARAQSIESLCKEAGISRELFYRWMERVRTAGLLALEAKLPGPKLLEKKNLQTEHLQLKEKMEQLLKENRKLKKENRHLSLVAKVAQRIIRRQAWGPIPKVDSKKNGRRV